MDSQSHRESVIEFDTEFCQSGEIQIQSYGFDYAMSYVDDDIMMQVVPVKK